MRRVLSLAAILTLAPAGALLAQPTPAARIGTTPRPLSLAEAIGLILKNAGGSS